ncbi:MAG: DNA recombination protein RmuC [Planctomycetota bacterium]|jgi:DNA recombination protein RmuC
MLYALCAFGGLIIGAVAAWFAATYRASAKQVSGISGLETRAASSLSRLEEVREQLQKKEEENKSIRDNLQEEISRRISSETLLEEERKNLKEQRELLEKAKKDLSDTFDALAGKALKNSGDEFIKLANETLEKVVKSAKGELGEKQNELKALVSPLQTSLEQYEKHIKEMEKSLKGDYDKVDEQVKMLAGEAKKLAEVLSKPQSRGQWGELALRNAVEYAGMTKYCDFEEQVTAESRDERTIRPDLKINMPGNLFILVDSKVPRDDYIKAIDSEDSETRESFLKNHAKKVRDHIRALAKKEYWKQEGSADFVVMFLPSESFFSAALMYDGTLIEEGTKLNVILASPINLIALLRAAALAWQQSKMAENAGRIADAARELFERVQKFGSHFAGIGSNLDKAREAFNRAVRSWETRVRPSGQKLAELGTVSESSEIKEIGMIEKPIREVPTEFHHDGD